MFRGLHIDTTVRYEFIQGSKLNCFTKSLFLLEVVSLHLIDTTKPHTKSTSKIDTYLDRIIDARNHISTIVMLLSLKIRINFTHR